MALEVIGSIPIIYPKILNFKVNVLSKIIFKKYKNINLSNLNIITTMKKFQFMPIFNFIYEFLNIKTKINVFFKKMTINSLLILNLKKKQPKINFIDLKLDKKYIYSIGLVLKILNTFKKSNRRVTLMLKNVITFVFKKHFQNIDSLMFIIKGFNKKLMEKLGGSIQREF